MLKIVGVIAVIGLVLLLGSVYIVNQQEQAITLRFGEPVGEVVNAVGEDEPGLKFKRPFIFENVLKFDKRILELNAEPNEIITKDDRRIIVDAFAKYRIVEPLKFYQNVRNVAQANNRLEPILNSRLRDVVSNNDLQDFLTDKRSEIMQQANTNLTVEAEKIGINIVDLRIMRVDFPKENSEQIFKRIREERSKEANELRAKGDEAALRITSKADKDKSVILANANKESEIIRGKGEAEATKIFAEAFGRDEEFYKFYRTMQAYRNTLKKGDTTMVLSPDSEFLQLLGDIEPASGR